MIKVIAFNGSPRKNGNTSILINEVYKELALKDIQTELIHIGTGSIKGCRACYKCFELKNNKCIFNDDPLNQFIEKMIDADGIILGSPVYFANATPEILSLIHRAGIVCKANGELFKQKVGASVVAVRRGGAIHVFNSLNHFFLSCQMIVPGSNYWNMAIGRAPGEVNNDQEGIKTMNELGKNMAWLLQKIYG